MYEIADKYEYDEEIKKSRFRVISIPVKSSEEAMAFLESYSLSSANHNCWAYKIGREYRFNDDGEPSGTAGKPILSAIEYADLTNIAVLVIRWFGGVKLGTGGLCRAYGGTASKCLSLAEKREIIDTIEVSIRVPFEQSNLLYHIIESSSITKIHEEYSPNGLIIVSKVPQTDWEEFRQRVLNSTNGKAKFEIKKES